MGIKTKRGRGGKSHLLAIPGPGCQDRRRPIFPGSPEQGLRQEEKTVDELEQFGAETRKWLEANCPESMRQPMDSDKEAVWGGRKATYDNPDAKLWLDRMGEKGWTTPVWPKEYGGGGLSKEENRVLQSELRRINARQALTSFGISMLGPVLLEYARATASRTRARTWPAWRARRRTSAITGW